MKNKAQWRDLSKLIEKQRISSTIQGNKDIRFMNMYLWLDRVRLDGNIKDMKAEYKNNESELYIEYKSSKDKLTIPEIESRIYIELLPIDKEIRDMQREASEMRMLYDSAKDFADAVKTDILMQKELNKEL